MSKVTTSAWAIPDYQTLMLPFLRLLVDGSEHTLFEVTESLAVEFNLTEAERNQLLPSGHQEIMHNRVGWARTYLKKASLILYIVNLGICPVIEHQKFHILNI